THSHELNSRRTSYSASRQPPSQSSPDAMQLSLRVQPIEWTQRLLSRSTQSTPEVVGRLTIPKQDMRSPRGQGRQRCRNIRASLCGAHGSCFFGGIEPAITWLHDLADDARLPSSS